MNGLVVSVSGRHCHLSQKDAIDLLGIDKEEDLGFAAPLRQPGHFASDSFVEVVAPSGTRKRVRVLGPFRDETQVELTATDLRTMDMYAPVCNSGDLSKTPGCRLEAEHGAVTLQRGLIRARRHVHMNEIDAAELKIKDGDTLALSVKSARSIVFHNVVARVLPESVLEVHLDPDEAHACDLDNAEAVSLCQLNELMDHPQVWG